MSEVDYVRGLVDGDGSLGLTAKGYPFVSLNTSSDAIAAFYIDFLHRVTGRPRKTSSRNKHDDTFNIAVFKEPAQTVSALLYYDGCLALTRKTRAAQAIRAWTRPVGMRFCDSVQLWTPEQDAYVLSHSVEDSMSALNRTKQSVDMRLWRLGHAN